MSEHFEPRHSDLLFRSLPHSPFFSFSLFCSVFLSFPAFLSFLLLRYSFIFVCRCICARDANTYLEIFSTSKILIISFCSFLIYYINALCIFYMYIKFFNYINFVNYIKRTALRCTYIKENKKYQESNYPYL